VKLLPNILANDVSAKVILYLVQDECYVAFIKDLNLGIIGPESIEVYTEMTMYLYKIRLIY